MRRRLHYPRLNVSVRSWVRVILGVEAQSTISTFNTNVRTLASITFHCSELPATLRRALAFRLPSCRLESPSRLQFSCFYIIQFLSGEYAMSGRAIIIRTNPGDQQKSLTTYSRTLERSYGQE